MWKTYIVTGTSEDGLPTSHTTAAATSFDAEQKAREAGLHSHGNAQEIQTQSTEKIDGMVTKYTNDY